jgi:hypothetical protein
MDRERHPVSKHEWGPEPRDALCADFESFYESLDLLLTTLVVGLVVGYAVHTFSIIAAKVRLVEPIFLSSSDRVLAHEHFAMAGSWPPPGVPLTEASDDSGRISRLTRAVTLSDGGRLDYALNLQGMPESVLSFRPFVAKADHPVSIVWLCASAHAPPQFVSSTVDSTTIDQIFLPPSCRKIGKR